ncbi:regulator of nonsense transcripts 2-like isoform X2 [Zophobas morio]|uniref:regulator of nonsense transcripts 2-like isoform X2 n=1 Tax=Zophobas morio TaxID=2755281 RepID=UPI0030838AB3
MEESSQFSRDESEPQVSTRAFTIESFYKEYARIKEARVTNITVKRPNEDYMKKLDSTIKKNSAFVKRLRNLSEDQSKALEHDFLNLNLTKYISEAVNAICEAKLKTSDVITAVNLCSLFHRRYSDFKLLFTTSITRIFSDVLSFDKKEKGTLKNDDLSKNLRKYRTALRLLGALVVEGIVDDYQLLINILSDVCGVDEGQYLFLTAVISFLKGSGELLLNAPSRSTRLLLEKHCCSLPALNILPEECRSRLKSVLGRYFCSASGHLLHLHEELHDMEQQNHSVLQLRGFLSADSKEAYEKLLVSYEKMITNVTALADLLDLEVPQLPVYTAEATRLTEGPGQGIELSDPCENSEVSVWDDWEQRSFYEDLLDLKKAVPGGLLEKQASKNLEGEKQKRDAEEPKEAPRTTLLTQLDQLLLRMPLCVSKDDADKIAVDFCFLNAKSTRKRLVKALFNIPRTRLDLIPYYARLAAVVSPHLPDVGSKLAQLLDEEFQQHMQKKEQGNLEARIRNVRFIAELTKFSIVPHRVALDYFQALLNDFTHHTVDVTCHFLENCGRYLYRSSQSSIRCKNLLGVMMRKRRVLHLDNRQTTAVENAYYFCNPPDRLAYKKSNRTPTQLYIQKLLYKDLNKMSVERVLKQLRKLNYEDLTTLHYVISSLSKPWKVKYYNVYCLASLVAGLSRWYDEVGVCVVDDLLEEVRIGLETNIVSNNQRRLTVVKFLGELYNFRVLDSSTLFDTMYTILFFSHNVVNSDTPFASPLDGPTDYFRIRLICAFIDTCAPYFDSSSTKKKFKYYLHYFQWYILSKSQPLPLDIDFLLQDTFETLRPPFRLCETYNQAKAEIERLQETFTKLTLNCLSNNEVLDETDENMSDTLLEPEANSDELTASQRPSSCADPEGSDDHEESIILRGKVKQVLVEEDEAFLSELGSLINESHISGRNTPGSSVSDLALPSIHRKENASKFSETSWRVMTRGKGCKHHFKKIELPKESSWVVNFRNRHQEEEAERDEMKRFILEYQERTVEEESSDGFIKASFTPQSKLNRSQKGRKHFTLRRYQN